jgi:excinuclease UvrABC nuclease subunit
MAAKTISLDFGGYWREPNIGSLPANSGIYTVYECSYNSEEGTVSLRRVISIGEADNVKDRIKNHEKWPEWRRYCGAGNQICFSCAEIPKVDRQRAEAALIFKHKPPVNTDYKDSFPFDQTTIILSGRFALLTKEFTVDRT